MTYSATKDPQAVLDYRVDWESWLGADTMASSAWFISGPDALLVADSSSNSSTATTVWLSGGALYRQYTVTNRVTTSEGRTDDRSITVDVVSK